MGTDTAIGWVDHTWNPWQGCKKVSAGCKNCYMFRDKKRYGQNGAKVVRSAVPTFRRPLKSGKGRWLRGESVLTCSWSDWFIEDADGCRANAWSIIRQRPDLKFLILTKRPERILGHLPGDWGEGYPNVGLGVSVENQEAADHRVPFLFEFPAAMRFVSCEPLLAPVSFSTESQNAALCCAHCVPRLDWVIVGGESGPDFRFMDSRWVQSLRDECEQAEVPLFFKQLSGPRPGGLPELDGRQHQEFPKFLRKVTP